MEKLWTVPEIMERYGWTEITAQRKIRKEMRHIGNGSGMRVPETALAEWEREKTREAAGAVRKASTRNGKKAMPIKPIRTGQTRKHTIPRTREEALRLIGMSG